ncbi:CMRF35-like molecule 1 isoform X1 [Tupaia chinensis]|uniref:CMRF35-like molecule 1 isoform X1 n=1 Tax=Tupaia chinensis TaxID=246437 RepID=UPI000FFBD8AA|nr:CMRF35-like molecule 1 isoform X1 [Tupaia chinensis]
MHLLPLLPLLFWLSGSSIADPITGPARVRGTEQSSLSVQCRYVSGWETYRKWWCRGADWNSCKILIQTTGSEQEVKKDRVSIRDDQENLTITVTMEALRRDDADTYWCGIERIGTDHGVPVEVTVDPAPTTVPTTTPSTSTFTTTVMATVTPRKTKGSPNLSSHHSDDRFSIMKPSILVPLIFATLLLFSVAISLLVWRRAKRQKKGERTWPGWAGWGWWRCLAKEYLRGLEGALLQRPPAVGATWSL